MTTIPVTLVILTWGRYDFKKFQRIFLTPEWNFSPRPFVYSPGALYHWATRNSWQLRPYFKSGINKSESVFYILFCPFPLIYWQTRSFSYFEKETAVTKALFIPIPSFSDVAQLIEKPFFNYNHIEIFKPKWNVLFVRLNIKAKSEFSWEYLISYVWETSYKDKEVYCNGSQRFWVTCGANLVPGPWGIKRVDRGNCRFAAPEAFPYVNQMNNIWQS